MSKKMEVPFNPMYVFDSYCISHLEGQVLTFIDASIQDSVQRKALKDLMSPMIWRWAVDANQEKYYKLEKLSSDISPK